MKYGGKEYQEGVEKEGEGASRSGSRGASLPPRSITRRGTRARRGAEAKKRCQGETLTPTLPREARTRGSHAVGSTARARSGAENLNEIVAIVLVAC